MISNNLTEKSTQTAIVSVTVGGPFWKSFDYCVELGHALQPGVRVLAPFRNRERVGILTHTDSNSDYPVEKLKPLQQILDTMPVLSPLLLRLGKWASAYYHHPLGEVLMGMLPVALRRGKSIEALEPFIKKYPFIPKTVLPVELSFDLNLDQIKAIENIQKQNDFEVFLLFGVTGSGKTEVYFQCIQTVLAQGKQVLILVPEISLTPHLIARFEERFSVPIGVFHSHLSEGMRFATWWATKHEKVSIVLGTRSAIFAPCPNLGLIILDEEHDLSFKQQTGFRYCAREVAIMRAHFENIPVILGSATPSLETWYNAKCGRYKMLTLPRRAGEALLPAIKIVDLCDQPLVTGLSEPALEAIQRHLDANRQVLVFLNRRGYAPVMLCHHCGAAISCRRCDTKLVFHQILQRLYCHHCGWSIVVPSYCPQCRQANLIPVGVGTEQLELFLQNRFPSAGVVRIDRDTTRKKNSLSQKLDAVKTLQAQILVGTQMIAKGHHFPNLTLVIVVDADTGLFSADFRSVEQLGQLLIQVIGRAGRMREKGEVLIQTHQIQHPLWEALMNKPYSVFAETLLQEREAAVLPPFSYLALMRAQACEATMAENFLKQLKNLLRSAKEVMILGPIAALIPKKKGQYHYQLLLQAASRLHLHQVLNELRTHCNTPIGKKLRWSIDVDPRGFV